MSATVVLGTTWMLSGAFVTFTILTTVFAPVLFLLTIAAMVMWLIVSGMLAAYRLFVSGNYSIMQAVKHPKHEALVEEVIKPELWEMPSTGKLTDEWIHPSGVAPSKEPAPPQAAESTQQTAQPEAAEAAEKAKSSQGPLFGQQIAPAPAPGAVHPKLDADSIANIFEPSSPDLHWRGRDRRDSELERVLMED